MLEEPVVYHQYQNPQFHQPHALPATYAHNPFAQPAHTTPAYQGVLATRSQRLLAKLIDTSIVAALLFIPLGSFVLLPMALANDFAMMAVFSSFFILPLIMLALIAAWLAVNCYFLYTRGQSPGKILLKIKIVSHENHSKIPGMEIVLIRTLVPVIINMFLPFIFDIVDVCFIFRDDHRCLHDIMANTTVIQA